MKSDLLPYGVNKFHRINLKFNVFICENHRIIIAIPAEQKLLLLLLLLYSVQMYYTYKKYV